MNKEKITVRNEHEIRPIETDRLLAVEVADYLCSFHIENEAKFTCSKSLKEVIELLPDFFVQINRSCLVNTQKIKSIKPKTNLVILSNDLSLKLSKRRAKALKDLFLNKE
jgi:DNA-binding LytR/AlgR family response regulator